MAGFFIKLILVCVLLSTVACATIGDSACVLVPGTLVCVEK